MDQKFWIRFSEMISSETKKSKIMFPALTCVTTNHSQKSLFCPALLSPLLCFGTTSCHFIGVLVKLKVTKRVVLRAYKISLIILWHTSLSLGPA